MIRKHFPDKFDRMAKLQRTLNTNFWQEPDGSGLFLDQLDPNRGVQHDEPVIECGVVCDSTELEAPRLVIDLARIRAELSLRPALAALQSRLARA
jgi:hypothetical protein